MTVLRRNGRAGGASVRNKHGALLRNLLVCGSCNCAMVHAFTQKRQNRLMSLLHLAPDIQEELLFLPEVSEGKDPISERMVRPIAMVIDWKRQRKMWRKLKEGADS